MTEHVNVDKLATERVLKARSELILARRFYGVLVSNVEPVLSRKFPTMATDSKRHYFNPEFIMSLTQDEVLGVQAHESEHDARHHGTRRNGRDHEEWNIACDYAINIDLVDEGFKLPKSALIDPKYRGMSAEDIYRSRELDKQNQPKPEDSEDNEPEENEDDDNESSEGSEGNESEDETEDKDDSESGSKDGDSDGSEDDESEDEGKPEAGGDDTGDAGEPEDKPEGDGANGGDEADEDAGEPSDEAGDGNGKADGEGDGEPTEPQSSGDPGGCGEVLDSAEDAGDVADEDGKWERIVRQAVTMAKSAGQLPGHVSREVERANNPPQDWREVLRAWYDSGALRKETWNRPNRRFAGGGLYLPGNQKDGVNKAAFLIDTSGSMDTIALALIRDETQAALDDGVIDEIVVVYGDTRVTRTDTYRTGDEIEFDPRGGGGTILHPLFDHVRDYHDDTNLIVCFSDMFNFGSWGDEPACPVLFAMTGYPEHVKMHMANTPWGAPGIDVGAH